MADAFFSSDTNACSPVLKAGGAAKYSVFDVAGGPQVGRARDPRVHHRFEAGATATRRDDARPRELQQRCLVHRIRDVVVRRRKTTSLSAAAGKPEIAAASATVWLCRVWRWQAPTPVLLATKPGRLITVRAKIREGVPGPILRQRTPAAHAGAFVRFADRDY